jgi:polar amino acid transport system substrate-binding protein
MCHKSLQIRTLKSLFRVDVFPINFGLMSLIFGLFLVLFLGSPYAFAEPQSVLQTVTADTNFPYNFVRNQRIQGLSVDVANELAKRLDMRLEVAVVPWTRALFTAKSQSSVMVFTVAKIPEREPNYYWIGPITHSEEWLFKLKRRSDVQVSTIEDAKRYLIGDEANNASIPTFEKLGIRVDTAPSMISNCRKFKIGRVDLIPFDPDGISEFAEKCDLTIDEIEKTIKVKRDTALYFAFGKKTPISFLYRLEKAFKDMVNDKSLSRINQKWKAGSSVSIK